jgi:hypothetical protein
MAIQKTKSAPIRNQKTRVHPEKRGFQPPRTGVLGTILTELQFDDETRQELKDLNVYLEDQIEEIAGVASLHARKVVQEAEGFAPVLALESAKAPRPSIARLRRRVAVQWLKATLDGDFDSYFCKQLRDSWMPILLSDPVEGRPAPVLILSFLDYMEGFLTGRLMDEIADNFVPAARKTHGLQVALEIQRRILGVS